MSNPLHSQCGSTCFAYYQYKFFWHFVKKLSDNLVP